MAVVTDGPALGKPTTAQIYRLFFLPDHHALLIHQLKITLNTEITFFGYCNFGWLMWLLTHNVQSYEA